MCVLIFYITLVQNISHSKKDFTRYRQKCRNFIYNTRYSCRILTKFEFSRQIFEESSNFKFQQNPSSGSRAVPCGRTGERHEAVVAFRSFSNAPKNEERDVTALYCARHPNASILKFYASMSLRLFTADTKILTQG